MHGILTLKVLRGQTRTVIEMAVNQGVVEVEKKCTATYLGTETIIAGVTLWSNTAT